MHVEIVSSVSTKGRIVSCVGHLPLVGSHTVFTVLYCTTAEEHPTLYRAYSVLQKSLQAVGRPQDSCTGQDRCFVEKDKVKVRMCKGAYIKMGRNIQCFGLFLNPV